MNISSEKMVVGLELWCLMPLSTIFQLYRGCKKWLYIAEISNFSAHNTFL